MEPTTQLDTLNPTANETIEETIEKSIVVEDGRIKEVETKNSEVNVDMLLSMRQAHEDGIAKIDAQLASIYTVVKDDTSVAQDIKEKVKPISKANIRG